MSGEMADARRYGLKGKVATMDGEFRVVERGIVYVEGSRIAAVLPAGSPPPAAFEAAPLVDTRGTIFPGLIELHNHLSYNVLPLWNVPRKYSNRSQWGGIPEYRRGISGPMQVLGRTPGYVEAIVRYVECKCLMAGVTTSQGIALFSNNGIQKYYKGVIRNVEETGDPELPDAATKISDVEASNAAKFLERLEKSSCMLLHLSEGVDDAARKHFIALQLAEGQWAVRRSLAGIHCAGLKREDFEVLKANDASMIWSPLSNLLLYGQTADIQAAVEAGVRIGLGSDWSPSGSKNLLGELKAAHLYSQMHDGFLSDREIIAMVTRNGAEILEWQDCLGSLEAGKRADLLVVTGLSGDPYARLVASTEKDVALVVIDGVARYGYPRLVEALDGATETVRIGGLRRSLNLGDEGGDPVVGALTLKAAAARLKDGMRRLPELAFALEHPTPGTLTDEVEWFLVLDHDEMEGETPRPQLPFEDVPTGIFPLAAPAAPLSEVLQPGTPDPLTVAGDPEFLQRIAGQMNLPEFMKEGLAGLYR